MGYQSNSFTRGRVRADAKNGEVAGHKYLGNSLLVVTSLEISAGVHRIRARPSCRAA